MPPVWQREHDEAIGQHVDVRRARPGRSLASRRVGQDDERDRRLDVAGRRGRVVEVERRRSAASASSRVVDRSSTPPAACRASRAPAEPDASVVARRDSGPARRDDEDDLVGLGARSACRPRWRAGSCDEPRRAPAPWLATSPRQAARSRVSSPPARQTPPSSAALASSVVGRDGLELSIEAIVGVDAHPQLADGRLKRVSMRSGMSRNGVSSRALELLDAGREAVRSARQRGAIGVRRALRGVLARAPRSASSLPAPPSGASLGRRPARRLERRAGARRRRRAARRAPRPSRSAALAASPSLGRLELAHGRRQHLGARGRRPSPAPGTGCRPSAAALTSVRPRPSGRRRAARSSRRRPAASGASAIERQRSAGAGSRRRAPGGGVVPREVVPDGLDRRRRCVDVEPEARLAGALLDDEEPARASSSPGCAGPAARPRRS